jgi:hypothetical protein
MDETVPSAANEDRLSVTEEPTADFNTSGPVPGEAQPLSKKARKRAAKAERLAVVKLERRAREKEAKKEKKRVLALKRAAGELDEDEAEKHRRLKKPRIDWGGKVVVDLGFDEMMSEKVGITRSRLLSTLVISGCRKSNHYVPNLHTPIVQTAMPPIRFPSYTLPSMVARSLI